jgi:predicted transcriptional regulator
MTGKRRSPLEINVEILEAIRTTHKPTQILYKTQVSWDKLRSALDNLTRMELIEKTTYPMKRGQVRARYTYALTDKGEKFLYKYREVIDIIMELV